MRKATTWKRDLAGGGTFNRKDKKAYTCTAPTAFEKWFQRVSPKWDQDPWIDTICGTHLNGLDMVPTRRFQRLVKGNAQGRNRRS